jgi:C4-type Zn-finger protein
VKLLWHNNKEFKIFEAAFKRNTKRECPVCGNTTYILNNGIYKRHVGKLKENVVSIHCKSCGFLIEFVADNFFTEEEKEKLNIK